MSRYKEKNKRRALASTAIVLTVSFFVLAMLSNALVMSASAYQRTRTVTITVPHAKGFTTDPMDVVGAPDFYLDAYVNGVKKSTSVYNDNAYEIYPNWVLSWSVTYYTTSPDKPVTLSLRDKDVSDDDTADLSRRVNKNPCDITLNMETGVWYGDDRYSGDTLPGYVWGEELPDGSSGTDQDDAALWFSIVVT